MACYLILELNNFHSFRTQCMEDFSNFGGDIFRRNERAVVWPQNSKINVSPFWAKWSYTKPISSKLLLSALNFQMNKILIDNHREKWRADTNVWENFNFNNLNLGRRDDFFRRIFKALKILTNFLIFWYSNKIMKMSEKSLHISKKITY